MLRSVFTKQVCAVLQPRILESLRVIITTTTNYMRNSKSNSISAYTLTAHVTRDKCNPTSSLLSFPSLRACVISAAGIRTVAAKAVTYI